MFSLAQKVVNRNPLLFDHASGNTFGFLLPSEKKCYVNRPIFVASLHSGRWFEEISALPDDFSIRLKEEKPFFHEYLLCCLKVGDWEAVFIQQIRGVLRLAKEFDVPFLLTKGQEQLQILIGSPGAMDFHWTENGRFVLCAVEYYGI